VTPVARNYFASHMEHLVRGVTGPIDGDVSYTLRSILMLPTFHGQFRISTMALGGLCHGTTGTQTPRAVVQAGGGTALRLGR